MDIAATKLELLDWVMHLNDSKTFEKLLALKAATPDDNGVVGYTVLGEPLDANAYIKHVDEGLEDIKNGRTTPHNDLLNEMESW